jgi:ribosome assembly protein YihI (activator of Der GTPase)
LTKTTKKEQPDFKATAAPQSATLLSLLYDEEEQSRSQKERRRRKGKRAGPAHCPDKETNGLESCGS